MRNKDRLESLRSRPPLVAVQAWLKGDFGFGDEPALTEAIRKDPQVSFSDDEIVDIICDALDEGLSAQECLERLRGPEQKQD